MSKLALRGGKPVRTKPFPRWPVYDEHELEALTEVLQSGVWGIGGSKQAQLERRFAEFCQARHAVSTTNGTTALEISLRSMGLGCGDEVIVPAYTFMATVTAVLYVNAIPVFADIEPDTYTLDPESVKSAISDKTKCILPVHIAGRPADMDAIERIAKENDLYVLEDACQAWGSEWRGRRVGAIGDMGTFSFQSSKNITSGEGGMIVTNNDDLFVKSWSLHNCGRTPEGEWYQHPLPGSNCRMTEFQAAVLLVQLNRLDEHTKVRMRNAKYLDSKLEKIDGIRTMKKDDRITRHSYHLYVFRYDSEAFGGASKFEFAKALQAEGIPATPGYSRPLYEEKYLDYFKKCPLSCPYYGKEVDYSKVSLPVTEKACYSEGIWLKQNLLLGSKEDMEDVVTAFEKLRENAEEIHRS